MVPRRCRLGVFLTAIPGQCPPEATPATGFGDRLAAPCSRNLLNQTVRPGNLHFNQAVCILKKF